MRSLLVVLALSAGCAAVRTAEAPAAPIRDASLGLAKGSAFEVLTPPAVAEEDSSPGEKGVRPRPFAGAAPVVPHGIQGFLPITPKENSCIACHGEAKVKKAGEPTPIPPTHYTDYTRRPPVAGEKLSGARWVCTSCHVQQTDARPIMGNRFGG
ncbi:MAG: nitrate reductase cytochrome c-type subunit [Deltaproteobacteria bacterium]|nr:nitrate reductase cytochrome c-type subunit [Deltaproteobacteria bacterium]